jgi:hypothetical protein
MTTPERRRALMDGTDLAAQSLDFILQVQLATLDFQYFEIIDREVLLSLGKFRFQRLMPQFKFHKMRLDGHQKGLLVSEWPDLTTLARLGGYKASRRRRARSLNLN